MAKARRAPFSIAGESVSAGKRAHIELPTARLVTGSKVEVPLVVLHGASDGPTAWISAAIHGDELNGIEIVRRVLASINIRSVAGTLIAVPIVNVHGFNAGERALPDGRDLNRSFPGSPRGSMASRIANTFMTEVIRRCDVGIDLHTGSGNRTNMPQIRGRLSDPRTRELAQVFGAPVTVDSRVRDGSVRQVAAENGATALLFEGGEANRFDDEAIAIGTEGVLRCLADIGMIPAGDRLPPPPTVFVRSAKWTRASRSGVLHMETALGKEVVAGEVVALLRDVFGRKVHSVKARSDGIVIGAAWSALIHQGEGIVNIAELE